MRASFKVLGHTHSGMAKANWGTTNGVALINAVKNLTLSSQSLGVSEFPQLVSERSAVLPEQTNTRVQIPGKHSSLALLQQHAVLCAQ